MVTIKEVAKEAGVSIATVSRVINDKGYISESTRVRVQEAMDKLNYSPHSVARALSMKQSFLLALIVPDASYPFYARMVYAVEQTAQKQGYKLLVCNSTNDVTKEEDYINMLRDNRVDGIILGSHRSRLEAYTSIGRPIITHGRPVEGIPCITADNYTGGQLATQHLIDKGCTRLLHIAGPYNKLNMTAKRRTDAFRLTCLDNDIHQDVVIFDKKNRYSQTSEEHINEYQTFIHNKVGQLLNNYDGVFCYNDYMAYELYVYCMENSIRVPEDLKIVGFNHSPFAQTLRTPCLTTIAQPIDLISQVLCQGIIHMVEGKDVHSQQLEVKLIEGTTT